MFKIAIILFSICVVFKFSYSYDPDKFCDKNLPASKISEFESCDQYLPKDIIDNCNDCLKEMNLGTTYKDFRNTICDKNLRNKYINCHKNKMRAQKQTETTTEMSEDKVEMFRKHKDCMGKALGDKSDS